MHFITRTTREKHISRTDEPDRRVSVRIKIITGFVTSQKIKNLQIAEGRRAEYVFNCTQRMCTTTTT